MLRTILFFVCVAVLFGAPTVTLGELFDDFSGAQSGSWAPARWWDDYACRGQFIVPGNKTPKLDVAFARAQRASEINSAGGFFIEVDVVEIRDDRAIIAIGSGEVENAAVAVVVYADNRPTEDQVYVYGKSLNIGNKFDEGEKVRIEIDTDDISEKDSQASVTVLVGDSEVVSNYGFRWRKSPLGFHLGAGKGRAVFDNLRIAPASPVIEFEGASASGAESDGAAAVNVVLKHPLQGQTYAVDYAVTGGTARGRGADYEVQTGSLKFEPGQSKKTITIAVEDDKTDERDETIKLTLSNARGRGVQLGRKSEYTYTITDRWPEVLFESDSGRVGEDAGSAKVKMMLAHACPDPVSVKYEVVGGTAARGKDYRLTGGILEFAPGEVAREIHCDIIDDRESENSVNETIILSLSETRNATPGAVKRHVLEIVDDEPGIEFDGSIWMCTYDKHTKIKGRNVLSLNGAGQLEWVSTYGDLLLTRLPKKKVSEVGDVAEYKWLYKGEGQARGSYVENICERYGSGDLRLAMLDSNGNPLSMDKQCSRNDAIFCGYKGYQARLSPHVPTDQRADKWAIRVNPNGDNCHSPVDWGGCWGFPEYFNGHGTPVGEFSPMVITVERTAEDTVAFSVTLNNEKHTYVDKDKSPIASDKKKMESLYGEGSYNVVVVPGYQPKNIDTMAIYFANQRPFERITFAKVGENLNELKQ
ncbi:MAG TPA: Calx-beta domain-containing protein [Sedimentisphaerales bacterium]|nr:Calx-beta domain-containing protein [Sedimentisphaerales bacterium]